MGNKPNSRAHLRMDVMVLLQYRKLTTEEYGDIGEVNLHEGGEELSTQSFSLQPFMEDKEREDEEGRVDPFILNALVDINLKLNLMLTMLTSEGETSIFAQKPIEVNLSEGGIGFTIGEQVKEGDILELNILLPIFPIAIIRAWGRVMRSTPLSKGNHTVGVEYVKVKEEDQDKIVHYLFKKQRESLRNQKV
jgi:hypothetical protein